MRKTTRKKAAPLESRCNQAQRREILERTKHALADARRPEPPEPPAIRLARQLVSRYNHRIWQQQRVRGDRMAAVAEGVREAVHFGTAAEALTKLHAFETMAKRGKPA